MRKVGGHGQKLSYYDFGHTTVYASRFDQRFPYCAYVPDDYEEDGDKTYPLAVIVHGTERGMLAYRDAFADFAEDNGVIVLCPLFPANICFPGDLSSYKMLRAGDLHYDAVMLDMIEEMRERYRIAGDRVMMYGFSGGGHFTHRFLYLHPERLMAASITRLGRSQSPPRTPCGCPVPIWPEPTVTTASGRSRRVSSSTEYRCGSMWFRASRTTIGI
jgi:predicted peptidase